MNVTTPKRQPQIEPLSIKQIIVAVDLSPRSEKTVAYAVGIAKCFGAAITLVHVYPSEPITYFTMERIHDCFAEERLSAERKLEDLDERIRQGYPSCTAEFCMGNPAEEVALMATKFNADLIVTASHYRSFLGQLFNLDQAPKITHRAPCPVLIYHEQSE
jgi:universal stress protein A